MVILSSESSPIDFWKTYIFFFFAKVVDLYLTAVQVSKPFFSILQKWLFSGELQDSFSEFFVAVNPELSHLEYLHPTFSNNTSLAGDGGFGGPAGQGVNPTSVILESGMRPWEGKYQFKTEMLPRFVGETFGKKVGFGLQHVCTYEPDLEPTLTLDSIHWKESQLHSI